MRRLCFVIGVVTLVAGGAQAMAGSWFWFAWDLFFGTALVAKGWRS